MGRVKATRAGRRPGTPSMPDRRRIARLCARWKVRELSLFGSVAAGRSTARSDVDLLVTFRPRSGWNLLDFVRLKEELEELFGRPVDLVDEGALANPFRRKSILEARKVLYAG